MGLTLGQASKECGKSKPTLSKAIKSGRLSAIKNDNGSFSIEPVELFRVYPKVANLNAQTPLEHHHVTPSILMENQFLKKENQMLKDQLADLKAERDKWSNQAQTLLLQSNNKSGFWPWSKK